MLAIPWKERKNCLRQVLDKNMRPYLKNKLSKKIWECDSNGRALAEQVYKAEFEHQYCQIQKNKIK
jgi:hypothetical protein